MVPWRATPEGFVSEDVLAWYERFAAGRPAALVVEATGIRDVPSGPLLRIGHPRFLPGLRRLVEVVRAASGGHTRLFIQIIDFLGIRRRPTRERYLGEFLKLRDEHVAALRELVPLSAAPPVEELRAQLLALDDTQLEHVLDPRELEALAFGARERVTDTQHAHIAELPAVLPTLFADAAALARDAGFDGVELHYAHAYTMASFLSAKNDRGDGYGGDLAGRLRLPLEVLAAVRDRVGHDFSVGCRMLSEEVIAGGSSLADAQHFARAFAAAGMDFLSISRGGKFEDAKQPSVGAAAYPYTGPSGHACMPSVFGKRPPFGLNLPQVAAIREALRRDGFDTPVVGAGGLCAFELAEHALQTGQLDLIGAARQSLADPDWFTKLRRGRGAQIRRCLFTNYCEALDQQHKQVTCQLWDRENREAPGVALSSDGRRRLVAP